MVKHIRNNVLEDLLELGSHITPNGVLDGLPLHIVY